MGNVIFSAPNWDIAQIFFVQIPLINEHVNILSVSLSVMLQKALLLMDVFILFLVYYYIRRTMIWIKWNCLKYLRFSIKLLKPLLKLKLSCNCYTAGRRQFLVQFLSSHKKPSNRHVKSPISKILIKGWWYMVNYISNIEILNWIDHYFSRFLT